MVMHVGVFHRDTLVIRRTPHALWTLMCAFHHVETDFHASCDGQQLVPPRFAILLREW